jgi:hypothetical protein
MADDIDVRRLRLQPGDILAWESNRDDVDLDTIGRNLRIILDRAGHADVPIWLCSGGAKLAVVRIANDNEPPAAST